MADDFSELMQLATGLESAADGIAPLLGKAIGVTSEKIKNEARSTVRRRNKRLSHAAGAIDYELTGVSGGVSSMSSEIGYDKEKPGGPLGSWVEYGAPDATNAITPTHDLGNALLNNEDDFVDGVARAADQAMREADL